jgi:hypothetical protein
MHCHFFIVACSHIQGKKLGALKRRYAIASKIKNQRRHGDPILTSVEVHGLNQYTGLFETAGPTYALTTDTPSASTADYLRLMRLDRPVGTLLLLWPTLAALAMAASGLPPLELIVIFTVGTFVMRSAGCVINDYADRHVDGAVKRT